MTALLFLFKRNSTTKSTKKQKPLKEEKKTKKQG